MYRDFLQKRALKTTSVSGLIRVSLSASMCLTLNACSTTSETFDCKAGKGVGCKSISEVNQMVDQGMQARVSPAQGLVERGVVDKLPLSSPVIANNSSGNEALSQQTEVSQLAPDLIGGMDVAVHRIQEEPLRVWIAPFQDAQGNLHEGSVIHTVLKPGYWQLNPPDQVGGFAPAKAGGKAQEIQ